MSIKSIEIRCLECTKWFESPIDIGSLENFDLSSIAGNITRCRKCGEFTPCNKENMRIRSDDGGFVGIDTV